jgi:phosphatidylglycerophosphatase A
MVIFFLLVIGVLSSACLERLDQKIDPAYVVIDEVVGMLITLWGIQHSFWWFAGAFCLFRFFDISKIFPICVIERHVPGGWGMMLDDVVAGFFSLIVLRLMMLVFPC